METCDTLFAGKAERADVRISIRPCRKREIIIEKLPHPRFESSILAIVNSVLDEYGIQCVHVTIEDYGALDFVLSARMTAAIKKMYGEC